VKFAESDMDFLVDRKFQEVVFGLSRPGYDTVI
jgi:hypothetical protein